MLEQQKVIYALALDKLARLGNGNHYGNSIGNDLARRALEEAELITPHLPGISLRSAPALPASTSLSGTTPATRTAKVSCRSPCPPCLNKFKDRVKLDKLFKCPAWTAKKEPGE